MQMRPRARCSIDPAPGVIRNTERLRLQRQQRHGRPRPNLSKYVGRLMSVQQLLVDLVALLPSRLQWDPGLFAISSISLAKAVFGWPFSSIHRYRFKTHFKKRSQDMVVHVVHSWRAINKSP
ncbi:hypothetical protein MVEG_08694 [Podila verticillata NRRL 6337]|nr:hypothetical protein MVEG_08694 [Podila verticillata NRRL 6337]